MYTGENTCRKPALLQQALCLSRGFGNPDCESQSPLGQHQLYFKIMQQCKEGTENSQCSSVALLHLRSVALAVSASFGVNVEVTAAAGSGASVQDLFS